MMLQLLGLAMLLPNDTEALRRDTAQCPLKPSAPNRHERKYFVVLTQPHSGADLLCKLLNRHPEISCAGELFNPTHASADRLGLTVEQQRADVQGFVQAHFDRCRTRVCGFRMMASHLPREALPKLFVPGCGVQKVRLQPATCSPVCGSVRSSVCSPHRYTCVYLRAQIVLERTNVTAEFTARSQGPTSSGTLDKFRRSHREWCAPL